MEDVRKSRKEDKITKASPFPMVVYRKHYAHLQLQEETNVSRHIRDIEKIRR